MTPSEVQTLLRAWIEQHEHPEKRDELFWAWEAVSDAVSDRPEEGWQLILELIREAPNNKILANVAAGPLEDLIVQHSKKFIDRIEVTARQDPRFRLALTGVWCEGDIPTDHFNRIRFYASSVSEPL